MERSAAARRAQERGTLSLCLEFSLIPGAGSTLSNNLQPSRVLSTSSARIAKAETWGCWGAPGLPKPHCEIPSRLLPMLFTGAGFAMARASPRPSSFVPFISAGRWISL